MTYEVDTPYEEKRIDVENKIREEIMGDRVICPFIHVGIDDSTEKFLLKGKTLYATIPVDPFDDTSRKLKISAILEETIEVDELYIVKAKEYMEKIHPLPNNTMDEIIYKTSFLAGIPFSAFIGLTGIKEFDSKESYLNQKGWYGKILEFLVYNQLQNSSKLSDHKTGEVKTKTFINGIFGGDIELRTDTKNGITTSFEESDLFKKLSNGINLFGLVHYKNSKTVKNLFRIDTGNTSELFKHFKSDYECGKLNPYNEYIKWGTKNSGKTRTVVMPERIVNLFAKKIITFD